MVYRVLVTSFFLDNERSNLAPCTAPSVCLERMRAVPQHDEFQCCGCPYVVQCTFAHAASPRGAVRCGEARCSVAVGVRIRDYSARHNCQSDAQPMHQEELTLSFLIIGRCSAHHVKHSCVFLLRKLSSILWHCTNTSRSTSSSIPFSRANARALSP